LEEKQVNEIIDNFLTKEGKTREVGRYYASELGMCPRKLYFSYKMPKQIDLDTIRIFEVGNIFHEFIAKVFANSKSVRLLENERSVTLISKESSAIVTGRIDDLIVLESGEKVIVDVKTIKSFDYLTEPKHEHKLQVMMYLKSLGIKKGGLLYVKKDDLQIRYFEFDYDELLVTEILDNADLVNQALKTNTPPRKTKDTWACKWCAYNNECKEADRIEEVIIESELERDEIWPERTHMN